MDDSIDAYFYGPAPQQRRTRGQGTDLQSILSRYFAPEFERLQKRQSGLESTITELIDKPIDFAGFQDALTSVAQGVSSKLYAPGGEVDIANRQALGDVVQSGFGTTSGGYDRARLNILRGANTTVSDAIAGAAVQLAPQAVQARQGQLATISGLLDSNRGALEGIRESMFGGQTTIEQLALAKQTAEQNRRLVEEALRRQGGGGLWGNLASLGFGLLGSVAGPAGAAVGGRLGGQVSDWLFGSPN